MTILVAFPPPYYLDSASSWRRKKVVKSVAWTIDLPIGRLVFRNDYQWGDLCSTAKNLKNGLDDRITNR